MFLSLRPSQPWFAGTGSGTWRVPFQGLANLGKRYGSTMKHSTLYLYPFFILHMLYSAFDACMFCFLH